MNSEEIKSKGFAVATLAGGCFWCVEAVFEGVDGVVEAVSGYTGGHLADPTYRQVVSGITGHAEAVRIVFDPRILSYERLLEWFWIAHDPTTLNRQGADVGTQYRSAIYYHDEAQGETARASKAAAQASLDAPIVTQISAAGKFYTAEGYHQDYFVSNPSAAYCRVVIAPKLRKLGLD